jgi:hypothetical protein
MSAISCALSGGLKQVVAADRCQAAGDKGDVARRIEQGQLAHRVAEKHLCGVVAGPVLRPRRHGHALLLDQFPDDLEPLRMSRNEHEQHVGTLLEQ